MNKIEKTLQQSKETIGIWLKEVDRYSPEEFKQSPGEGQWTIGQVYMHLLLSANVFFVPQIEKCLSGHNTVTGPKNMTGRLVYLLGMFPPVRVKIPKALDVAPTPQPDKAAHVKLGLEALLQSLEGLAKKIEKDYDPVKKRKHPVFGPLNAVEWFQATEMHFRHHLRQKKRIDQALGKK